VEVEVEAEAEAEAEVEAEGDKAIETADRVVGLQWSNGR